MFRYVQRHPWRWLLVLSRAPSAANAPIRRADTHRIRASIRSTSSSLKSLPVQLAEMRCG